MDPDDKVLLEGTNERQGDFIFTANKVSPRSSSKKLRQADVQFLDRRVLLLLRERSIHLRQITGF